MQRDEIQSEVTKLEDELIRMSTLVGKEDEHDSMLNWIKSMLNDGNELARYFLIPSDKRIREALRVLVSENNPLSHPIINTISNRIGLLLSGTGDLRHHPLTSSRLLSALKAFDSLVLTVSKYRIGREIQKSVSTVYQAMKANRLYTYKTLIHESDLRIVLKTLQVDRDRTNIAALKHFLEYLYDQLTINHSHPGHIQHARHTCWALLDLFELADPVWLKQHQNEICAMIGRQCEATEYVSPQHNLADIVPEMTSDFYERIWVTIDMMRIFRDEKAREIIDPNLLGRLKDFIHANMSLITLQQNDRSIRSIQCKLIFLYEATIHVNYLEILDIIDARKLDVSRNFIGRYLYSDDVLTQYREIEESIIGFINGSQKWRKHSTTCLLVSGSAGQGKSELATQISDWIQQFALARSSKCIPLNFAVGREIRSQDDIEDAFRKIENHQDQIRVVFFDEVDKARDFDFFTPFLTKLESQISASDSLTFWIFAQSSFPSFGAYREHADGLPVKSLRDFLTRIQLGYLNVPDLRGVFIQRILTVLGVAKAQNADLTAISERCIKAIFFEQQVNNNRDLIGLYTRTMIVSDSVLMLKSERARLSSMQKIAVTLYADAK
jgi:hypothetical protein